MEQDLKRLSICSQNDKFCDTAVQGFGGFVGAFFSIAYTDQLVEQVLK